MKMIKKVITIILVLNVVFVASAFDKGWVLGLQSDFGGSLTLPSIPLEDIKQLNDLATGMKGSVSPMLMGGQATVGYIFDAHEAIPSLSQDSNLSGFAVKGYLGIGQGSTCQIIEVSGGSTGGGFDLFMNVNFLPVINFGVEGEILLFNNRFSVGLGLGTRAIMDMSPSFLVYSSDGTVPTEVGEIIVSSDMMTKMNAFAFSTKLDLGYSVPILPTTELVLGAYTQFNLYRPKYLTVPPSLAAGAGPGINNPFPNYWLNSLDFGVNIGLMFRL